MDTFDKEFMINLYKQMNPRGSGPLSLMRMIRQLVEGIALRDGYLEELKTHAKEPGEP